MRVGDYELERKLGEGAFGATHMAKHVETGDTVVLKRLSIQGLPDWKPFERFEREAKVLRSLDHPGVVRFVDAFEADEDFYIVSALVLGDTLGQKIERGDRWTRDAAEALLRSLLEILVYLHGLSPRVVHRDIKPGNVIVEPGGDPVLVDFGAVSDLAARRADGGVTVAGTAGYMPPEQAMGNPEPRSDLYALGATMLHALSHTHPSDLPRKGLRLQIPADVGVSDAMRRVIQRLVEPNPTDRFVSAESALAALDHAESETANGLRGLEPPLEARTGRRALSEEEADNLALPDRRAAEPTALARFSTAIERAGPRDIPAELVRIVRNRGLPANPLESFLKIFGPSLFGVLAGLVMLRLAGAWGIVMIIVSVMLPAVIGEAKRRTALAQVRDGQSVQGHILEAENFGDSALVRYRFRHDGTAYDGVLRTYDRTTIESLANGDPVHAFFTDVPAKHVALLGAELSD